MSDDNRPDYGDGNESSAVFWAIFVGFCSAASGIIGYAIGTLQ